jgi:hypothetical protein
VILKDGENSTTVLGGVSMRKSHGKEDDAETFPSGASASMAACFSKFNMIHQSSLSLLTKPLLSPPVRQNKVVSERRNRVT